MDMAENITSLLGGSSCTRYFRRQSKQHIYVFTGKQITSEPAQSVVIYGKEIWAGTKSGILKFNLDNPKSGKNAINKFKVSLFTNDL